MNAYKIVSQLKTLAQNPENRVAIVRDQGCLPGLVLFLDNSDERVVTTALEALQYLAEDLDNKPVMRKEMGMLISLRTIKDNPDSSPLARELSASVENLISPMYSEKRSNITKKCHSEILSQSTNKQNSNHGTGNSFFIGGVNSRKAKLMTFLIKGMDDLDCRKTVEQALIKIRGIISFTFDIALSRIFVRSKAELDPARICQAVDRTGTMTALQVLKDDSGKEVFVGFSGGKENYGKVTEVPDYLPEDDDVSREFENKKALSRNDPKKDRSGWLGSVGNYLVKNLYW
eukprot:Sdes_comp20331_c0_seq1m14036